MSDPIPDDVAATGELARQIAEMARRTIGPNGTMMRLSEEDAPLMRSAFVARVGEAAMRILDGEDPS